MQRLRFKKILSFPISLPIMRTGYARLATSKQAVVDARIGRRMSPPGLQPSK